MTTTLRQALRQLRDALEQYLNVQKESRERSVQVLACGWTMLRWVRRKLKRRAAEDMISASKACEPYHDQFPSLAKLKAFLKSRPEIWTEKPSSQRLTVHAGHLAHALIRKRQNGTEMLDEAQRLADIERAKRGSPK